MASQITRSICTTCRDPGAPALWFPAEQCKIFYNRPQEIRYRFSMKLWQTASLFTKSSQRLKHRNDVAVISAWSWEDVLYVEAKDGLAKGGSLLVQWLSAADSWGTGVRYTGRQDTATWQAGPNCQSRFLQSGLKKTFLISVALLSQEIKLFALMLENWMLLKCKNHSHTSQCFVLWYDNATIHKSNM